MNNINFAIRGQCMPVSNSKVSIPTKWFGGILAGIITAGVLWIGGKFMMLLEDNITVKESVSTLSTSATKLEEAINELSASNIELKIALEKSKLENIQLFISMSKELSDVKVAGTLPEPDMLVASEELVAEPVMALAAPVYDYEEKVNEEDEPHIEHLSISKPIPKPLPEPIEPDLIEENTSIDIDNLRSRAMEQRVIVEKLNAENMAAKIAPKERR